MDISVALCTDEYGLAGLIITINSMIKNCSNPSRLRFYILVSEQVFKDLLIQYSTKLFGNVNVKIEVVPKDIEHVIPGYNEYCKGNIHCKNLMNFSRFFIGDIFPELQSYLYIDTDYLIVDDIIKLWDSVEKDDEFYAVPSEYSNERAYSLTELGKQTLELSHRRPFNAGIYIVNAEIWRRNKRTQDFIGFVNSQQFQKMFRFGTQPLLNYIYQDIYVYLPTCWNRIAYDKILELGDQRPIDLLNCLTEQEMVNEGVSALHFAGMPKPWLFSNQMCGGCWPSPNSMYKKYLSYKENIELNRTLLDEHKDLMDIFKDVLNDLFSVNLVFTTKKVSDTDTYILSQIKQTPGTDSSSMYFIVIGGKVVINNTGQQDKIVEELFLLYKDASDGIFLLQLKDDQVRVVRKNLFESDVLSFQTKANEYNFKKLVSAYVFLERLW